MPERLFSSAFTSAWPSRVLCTSARTIALFCSRSWRFFERERYLRSIDKLWKHHLKVMESLRQGVYLEAYGQKDPKLVYKKQGYELFEMMLDKVEENVTETLFRAKGPSETEIQAMRQKRLEEEQKLMLGRGQMEGSKSAEDPKRVVHQGGTFKRSVAKVGRNEACPCGSGKKYKKCCGR